VAWAAPGSGAGDSERLFDFRGFKRSFVKHLFGKRSFDFGGRISFRGFAGGAGARFPGGALYSPLDFSGVYTPLLIFPMLLLQFSIFSGGIYSPAHFRIFSHFRNISPFFAFFLRFSLK
jgi:hypothetical protein